MSTFEPISDFEFFLDAACIGAFLAGALICGFLLWQDRRLRREADRRRLYFEGGSD